MAAPAKKDLGITLPNLNIGVMDVHLVGDAPLCVHNWSTKAKGEMLAKHMKIPKGPKEAKDPRADFEASLYRLGDGGYGFPSIAFKSAAVTAVTSVSGVTKVAARQAFHVVGEDVDVRGIFDGVVMRQNLVRIIGEPRMREDPVKVGIDTADIRYRAEFWPWRAVIMVRYNANMLSESQILNLFNTAGFACGVGEWRPERDGSFGMFHVATEADLDIAPAKKRGRK